VILDAPRADRVKLVPKADAPQSARAAFAAWLGQPHPIWVARGDGTPPAPGTRPKMGGAT
jgi:hypothetical protein